MAAPQFAPEELQDIRDLAARWGKIVARHAFGDAGPGLDADLATLERVALAAAGGLTEGTLAVLLQQQAQALPAETPCPACGRSCPIRHEPRTLATAHGGALRYREPAAHCPACRRDFFPSASGPALGGHSYTPILLERIITLAGRLASFEQVAVALEIAADVKLTGRQVQRLTQEVGAELAQRRDEQAERYRRRELPSQAAPPPVAVVEVDGGRLGTRQTGAGPGVHQPQAKEDKIACLVSVRSDVHAADPQPEPPATFRDARRVARLVRQFQGQAPPADEAAADAAPAAWEANDRPDRPEPLLRTCVASMSDSRAFGPMAAAEAQARGFFDASRQAFLGDGQKYNWRIQRAYFPHFEAVADFLHVLCYLYRGAWAVGADEAGRWRQFEAWMRACWQGRVGEVLSESAAWQERLGRPPPEADEQDPRRVVKDVERYLWNNRERMDYPRYRRMGLPVTSSWVESLVGEFNGRVKGRDKYWNRSAGAEAILQVRTAVLSEDGRLTRYFAERHGNPYRRRQPVP